MKIKRIKWRSLVVNLLLAEFFIALPAVGGRALAHVLITNPRYELLCLQRGVWGIGLGLALPPLLFQTVGSLAGYCVLVLVGRRIYGPERFYALFLGGKEIWLFSALTRYLLRLGTPDSLGTVPTAEIESVSAPIASPNGGGGIK